MPKETVCTGHRSESHLSYGTCSSITLKQASFACERFFAPKIVIDPTTTLSLLRSVMFVDDYNSFVAQIRLIDDALLELITSPAEHLSGRFLSYFAFVFE